MDPEKAALIRTLQELQHSIEEGAIENIKNLINCFHENQARNKQLLLELYTSGIQCPTQNDLILAACQTKKAVLYYILKDTDILVHLTDGSFDETVVNNERTEAIKRALTLEDFDMVEMLYDFWCGNLHWSGHDIMTKQNKNIEMLGKVLQNARDACPDNDDQLQANFHCLLTFNAFQREIYTELAGIKSSAITVKETATTLLEVLRIYDEYSYIEKIRRKHTEKERELATNANINDESSIYYKNLEYIYYEVYFRKLDFNVALLILENLFILREHLKTRFNKNKKYFKDNLNTHIKNDANTYEEIESAIYHFIYSTSEHWQWYLPNNRQIIIEEHTITHEGITKNFKLTLDLHKLYAPVICFERKSFKESFEKLTIILEEYVIRDDPAINDKSNEETLLNENYLQTVSYMRDHYSLIKIVYYIKAIEKTTDIDVIMVERALHVVGEMLKSTVKSCHLSPSTQALLQTAISVETINHLQNIRNFLSHAREGKLSKRIDMAKTEVPMFEEIKEELIMLTEIINPILDIVKSILDKSLLEKGLRLLKQRIKDLPDKAKCKVDAIYQLYERHNKEEWKAKSRNYYQEVWRPLGLTLQLLDEIPWIKQNEAKILTDIQLAKTNLNAKIARILPSLLPYARQILKPIIETIEKVNQYDQSVQMSKYPDDKEITEIRKKLKKLMKKKPRLKNIVDLKLLNKINDYKDHWESVKGMLSFCFDNCELFDPITVKVTELSVKEASNLIADMEAICVMHGSTLAWLTGRRAVVLGLKIYRKFQDWRGFRFNQKHFENIEKLYQIASKKIKPDAPKLAREKLISCLISRLDLLKKILLYSKNAQQRYPPENQLVQRFDHDVKFRITIEMILADIANVLDECKILSKKRLMNKSSKLLKDINLGNVLDHGNPFLEVIGDIFNSHDLAAEWLDKATMFAKDLESIEALYKLFVGQIDYRTIIEGDLDKMDDQQKQLYIEFKQSPRWDSYALLTRYTIPKSQRS